MGRRIELKLEGAYRDLTSLRFYGLGNDSDVDDRSTYLLRDKTLMGSAWLNPRGLLSFGAQGGIIRARTDSGDAETSLEENFDAGDMPGFGLEETEFLVCLSLWRMGGVRYSQQMGTAQCRDRFPPHRPQVRGSGFEPV